jgi:uncharacterized protein YeaO (DUF488 family)
MKYTRLLSAFFESAEENLEDIDSEIEKHIDYTEELLQLVSHDEIKFNEFLNKFNDEKTLCTEFERYIKTIYPSCMIVALYT